MYVSSSSFLYKPVGVRLDEISGSNSPSKTFRPVLFVLNQRCVLRHLVHVITVWCVWRHAHTRDQNSAQAPFIFMAHGGLWGPETSVTKLIMCTSAGKRATAVCIGIGISRVRLRRRKISLDEPADAQVTLFGVRRGLLQQPGLHQQPLCVPALLYCHKRLHTKTWQTGFKHICILISA